MVWEMVAAGRPLALAPQEPEFTRRAGGAGERVERVAGEWGGLVIGDWGDDDVVREMVAVGRPLAAGPQSPSSLGERVERVSGWSGWRVASGGLRVASEGNYQWLIVND